MKELLARKAETPKPTVVCLCGSTRFVKAFVEANLRETLAGRIVLSIGCNTKSDHDLEVAGVHLDKDMLDVLHLFKIDLADEILVLNGDGYIGASTRREITYARRKNKRVRYLEIHPCLTCGDEAYEKITNTARRFVYWSCGGCLDDARTVANLNGSVDE